MGAGSLLAHGASSARLASLTFVLFLLVSSTSTWVLAYDVYEDGAVGQSLPGMVLFSERFSTIFDDAIHARAAVT